MSARERAARPDRAVAYVDATGKRRLPIHDAALVRNVLVLAFGSQWYRKGILVVSRDLMIV